ncbi:hypothetical protein BGX29_004984 [Mortierella sp. GBA35]|nr:hypothetical protein BGX29_004984 [Mortierella sp. GBA35]
MARIRELRRQTLSSDDLNREHHQLSQEQQGIESHRTTIRTEDSKELRVVGLEDCEVGINNQQAWVTEHWPQAETGYTECYPSRTDEDDDDEE